MSYLKGVDNAWGRYPSIYSWLSGEDNQGLRSKSLNLLSSIIDHDDSGNWKTKRPVARHQRHSSA